MIKVLSFLIVAIASFSSFGAPKAYIKGKNHFFGEVELVTDLGSEEIQVIGNTDKIERLFLGNDRAMRAASESRRYGLIGHGIFFGSVIGSVLLLNSDNSAKASLAALVGGVLFGGHFLQKSATQVYKAINIYNGISEDESVGGHDLSSPKFGLQYAFKF